MTTREKLEILVPKLYSAAHMELMRARKAEKRLKSFPLWHRVVSPRYGKLRQKIRAHRSASMLMTAMAVSSARQLIKLRKTGNA